MSLINQALRKAQRDRTPQRMPESGAAVTAPFTTPNGMKPSWMIGLLAAAVVLLLGVFGGMSLVLLNSKKTPSAGQPAVASSTTAPATEEPASANEPALAATTPADSAQAPNAAPAALERLTNAPVIEELRQASAAAGVMAAAAAQPKAAAEQATVQPNQEIIDWLARIQISGERLPTNENRIRLNGKSYAAGEYVHPELSLRVFIIEEKRALFIDENHKKYLKHF